MTANLDRQAITSDGFVVGVAHGQYNVYRALGNPAPPSRGDGFLKGRTLGSVPAQLLDDVDLAELCRGGMVRADREYLERRDDDAAARDRFHHG